MSATTAPSPSDGAPRTSARSPADVVARAGLPTELGELVLAVTGKLRLWPRERIDVARELCAHFADGLAEGRTPAELASDFGTPRDTARLITRAKKRTRPWWYRSWVHFGNFCGVLLLAFVVFYTFAAIRYYVGKPSIRVDYLAQLNAPVLAVPPEDRAWPRYLRAYLTLPVQPVVDGRQILLTDLAPGSPEWIAGERYVRDNAAILAELRAASRLKIGGYVLTHSIDFDLRSRPGSSPVPPSHSTSTAPDDAALRDALVLVQLPHLATYRDIARVLAFDALIACRDGDAPRTLDNIEAIFAIARHSSEPGGMLIGQLVGNAVFALGVRTVERVFAHGPGVLSDDQLTSLAATVASWRANPAKGDDSLDFSGERVVMLDMLQRVYTDDGSGDGRLANTSAAFWYPAIQSGGTGPSGNFIVGPFASQIIAGRASTLRAYDEALQRIAARSTLTLRQRDAQPLIEPLQSGISKLHFLYAATMIPSLERASVHTSLAGATREAVTVGLALERYQRQFGRYPGTLRELVPAFLPAIPGDPWDGGEMKYLPPSADRTSPKIYSVGRDLADDLGDETLVSRPISSASPPQGSSLAPEPRDVVFWASRR